MKQIHFMSNTFFGAAGAMVAMAFTSVASATEPCGDLGECKALIEINATDGDIGFHFLMDGDDLIKSEVRNPDGFKIFEAIAKKEEREQFMTETFVESAEPLCWPDPDALAEAEAEGEELEIVTLEEFLELWTPGTYEFTGRGEEGEMASGETDLLYEIPAAPSGLGFDGSVISWAAGVNLGNCATEEELDDLVTDEVLLIHPKDVPVDAWEIVFEPDVEDGDELGQLKFTIRVSGDLAGSQAAPFEVTVPAEYLASLPAGQLVKIEVGAIGGEDNATFTEIFDICVTATGVCP